MPWYVPLSFRPSVELVLRWIVTPGYVYGEKSMLRVSLNVILSGTMLTDPLKDTSPIVLAVCKVVAVLAFPVSADVIVLAAKLPDASRTTTFEAVAAVSASTAQVVAAEPLKFEPVKYVPRVRVFVVLAVTVMFAVPSNDTPLIVRAVKNLVDVAEFPARFAVIVFAEKLPAKSRTTTTLLFEI